MRLTSNSIGAVYCVYHDYLWLKTSVASIYEVVDRIFFLVGKFPWNGAAEDNSYTLDLIRNLPDPEKKCRLIIGEWKTQPAQRNFGLELLEKEKIELCLVIDADEIYETDVLSQAINNHCGDKEIQVWHLHWITYWKSPFYRIAPLEKYRPPVILRVGAGKFTEYRNLLSDKHRLIPPRECIIHHLSYARPNYLIRRKVNSVSASPLINPGWYQDVWLKWDQDRSLKNLHPVTPHEFQQAQLMEQEFYPTILEDLIEKYTPSASIVESVLHTKEFFRNLYTGEFPEMLQELSEDK